VPRAGRVESIRSRTYASLKSSWLIATTATSTDDSMRWSSDRDAEFSGSTIPTSSDLSRSSSGSMRCCWIIFAGIMVRS
jgi:hypothetical protein